MAKSKRRSPKPRPPKKSKGQSRPKGSFWEHKTAEEIVAEQGHGSVTNLDELMGAGKDLFRSDEEFNDFLEGIYRSRREGREP